MVPGPLAARLHAALPQTQCTRCGYPDCAAYASAIAQGDAGIDRCPPGGAEGVDRLAAITGLPVVPLDPSCGAEGPRRLAVIDEDWCIGCTLCLDVCPTDAIVGASKRMHTVIDSHCTGCELCVPVCPVDCIAMDNATGERTGWAAWSAEQAAHALRRYEKHSYLRSTGAGYSPETRASDALPATATAAAAAAAAASASASASADAARKQAVVAAALAAARARRGA